jgi:hypothetical protein
LHPRQITVPRDRRQAQGHIAAPAQEKGDHKKANAAEPVVHTRTASRERQSMRTMFCARVRPMTVSENLLRIRTETFDLVVASASGARRPKMLAKTA